MKYALNASAIGGIEGALDNHPRVEKALLFGYRAKGNCKHGSDIDLTLFGEALGNQEMMDIAMELDDLLLPYTIDLSIFEKRRWRGSKDQCCTRPFQASSDP